MIVDIEKVEVTGKDLATFFHKSRQTIRAWTSKGMPKNRRGAHPLLKCFEWWYGNICTDGKDNSLTEERRQKIVVERQIKELELAEKQESLVPKDQAYHWVGTLVSAARLGFMGLPRRSAASLITMKDEREIEVYLRGEIHEILRQLAEGGRKRRINEKDET